MILVGRKPTAEKSDDTRFPLQERGSRTGVGITDLAAPEGGSSIPEGDTQKHCYVALWINSLWIGVSSHGLRPRRMKNYGVRSRYPEPAVAAGSRVEAIRREDPMPHAYGSCANGAPISSSRLCWQLCAVRSVGAPVHPMRRRKPNTSMHSQVGISAQAMHDLQLARAARSARPVARLPAGAARRSMPRSRRRLNASSQPHVPSGAASWQTA